MTNGSRLHELFLAAQRIQINSLIFLNSYVLILFDSFIVEGFLEDTIYPLTLVTPGGELFFEDF